VTASSSPEKSKCNKHVSPLHINMHANMNRKHASGNVSTFCINMNACLGKRFEDLHRTFLISKRISSAVNFPFGLANSRSTHRDARAATCSITMDSTRSMLACKGFCESPKPYIIDGTASNTKMRNPSEQKKRQPNSQHPGTGPPRPPLWMDEAREGDSVK